MKINVLGTEYKIIDKKEAEDERLKRCDGYLDDSTKEIVLLVYEPDVNNKKDLEAYRKQVLRHEIIHAFLSESGLQACSVSFGGGWATNEEMVDWLAIQFPKIQKAFEEVGCM